MPVTVWQVFEYAGGRVAVPAATVDEARGILARNAWNKRPPLWPWVETITASRPPWSGATVQA